VQVRSQSIIAHTRLITTIMSNAPPTPPPTTAAEIQDEQRDSASAAAPASESVSEQPEAPLVQPEAAPATNQPPPAPVEIDVAQEVFPQIVYLAKTRKWYELAYIAEDADCKVFRLI
jgi:COP9 signalosome complex subunit 8